MNRCQLAMTWNGRATSRESKPNTIGSQGRQWLEASSTPAPAFNDARSRPAPTHSHEVIPWVLRRYVGRYHWMIRAQNRLKRGGTNRYGLAMTTFCMAIRERGDLSRSDEA